MLWTGPVRADQPISDYDQAVQQACSNSLAAARNMLTPSEMIAGVLQLTVFIACETSFQEHSALADYASTFFADHLGDDGVGTRAAVGVLNLPGNAPVEIQIVATIKDRNEVE